MGKSKAKGKQKRSPALDRAGRVKGPRRADPPPSPEAAPSQDAGEGGPISRLKPSSRRPRPKPTRRAPDASGRYTPPIPRAEKVSPIWVPILMFTALGVGMAMIILNYVNLLPGSDPSNTYLMIGLGLIALGFITATRYH